MTMQLKFWQQHCNDLKSLTPLRGSNSGSSVPEAAAMTTVPRRQGMKFFLPTTDNLSSKTLYNEEGWMNER
jgi:hypothetical protein